MINAADEVQIFTVVRFDDDSAYGYMKVSKVEVLHHLSKGFLRGATTENISLELDDDNVLWIG
jgi:hypothetical protein